jgi:hypothetical protein
LNSFQRSNWSPTYILHLFLLVDTSLLFIFPKLLSFSVLTFIKWRLTPSYAAKDTIFWQKRPKTITIRIIVQDNKNSNLFLWPSTIFHVNGPFVLLNWKENAIFWQISTLQLYH